MKTSETFRHALKNLWDGVDFMDPRCRHVCNTFEEVPAQARERCVGIVRELLYPSLTLESWLIRQHGLGLEDCSGATEYNLKMQETRRQWLLHLIAHYESLGD
jgi:hypothetical protein